MKTIHYAKKGKICNAFCGKSFNDMEYGEGTSTKDDEINCKDCKRKLVKK